MSLKTSLAGATAAIGLTALAYPAQAALYSFTYTHGGPTTPIVVTGKLTGTAAGQVITVTNFSDLKYNSTDLSSWTGLLSYTNFITGLPPATPLVAPKVSLDSSVVDIVFGVDGDFSQNITLGPVLQVAGTGLSFTSAGADLTPNTNGSEEAFGTLTVTEISQQAIPEPSAVVALLGLGLGALASKVRKQG